MDRTILLVTFSVELLMGVLGFISMHLRAASKRRHQQELPRWQLMPYDFKCDYFQGSNVERIKPPKITKPRSRLI
ncbi:hypothetical protein QIJ28_gp1 [ssRNA phage Gerhypos.3_3]|uniref:Transmembrane protein n=2 Tax=Fiersviridae TaxID=2842319 RepID=A0A8S5KYM4_9VIRU|nr:hypothetical protein QIJ28_gp1 [ssRNA phage Gerhypos.3_3]QDH87371.1 MAG: hypothetical protein H3Bulk40652_000001 [Leviviridae sp.]DAD50284.1 TPA_asm: hypothetical protein [ssRNA phage Gerhypos.3_3]